jgi:hypothetical protein
MKIPAWGYVVGIFMMLLGGFGIIGDLQYINSPTIITLQKEVLDDLTKDIRIKNSDSTFTQIDLKKATSVNRTDRRKLYNNVATTLYKILDVSDFTLKWVVRFGYIGLLFSVFKIVSGIFLLIRKPFSYILAASLLILSLGLNIMQFMIFGSDYTAGLLSVVLGYSQLFFALMNLILLVVVLTSDKTAYFESQSKPSESRL